MGEKVATHLQQGASIRKSRSSSFSVLWTCRYCLAPSCTAAAHSRLTSDCSWQIVHNILLELIHCTWSARSSNQILIMDSWVQDVLLLFHTNYTYWESRNVQHTWREQNLMKKEKKVNRQTKEPIQDRITRNIPQIHAEMSLCSNYKTKKMLHRIDTYNPPL